MEAAYRQLLGAYSHAKTMRDSARRDGRNSDGVDADLLMENISSALFHVEKVTGIKAPCEQTQKTGRPKLGRPAERRTDLPERGPRGRFKRATKTQERA